MSMPSPRRAIVPTIARILGASGAILLGACQATGHYLADRGRDATDVLRAQVMCGKGGGAVVEATQFLGLGMLMYRGTACGIGTRTIECRDEAAYSFDAGYILTYYEKRVLDGAEPGHMHAMNLSAIYEDGRPFFMTTERGFAPWLSARAGLMIFVGFDIEVRGGELLDFIAGLGGWDPSGDDAAGDDADTLPSPALPVAWQGVARAP